jgi:hypothetical protein
MEAREEALSALRARAEGALRQSGQSPTPPVLQRIAATFEAICAWGRDPGSPRPGRLTQDVEPPGLKAMLGLAGAAVGAAYVAAEAPPPEKAAEEGERARKLEEARRRLASAEAALAEGLAAEERAEQDVHQAESRLTEAKLRAEEARARILRVQTELGEARAALAGIAWEPPEVSKSSK